MLHHVLANNIPEEKRTKQRSRNFSRLFLTIGIVLLLSISYVSAVDVTDGTNIPVIQTLNVSSLTPTMTPAISNAKLDIMSQPPTLVPDATLITAVPTDVSRADPTLIRTLSSGAANDQYTLRAGRLPTQAEKEAAAANYKETREAYLMQGSSGANQIAGYSINAAPVLDPNGIPHYFGPFPNWANSPMPMGNISNITVDNGGHGYTAPVITLEDVYFTGFGATASATVTGGVITGITVTNPGTNYTAPVVIITDATGSDASATAILGGPFKSGIRKFVDTLPGLNAAGANNLGQYIPVAIPDTTTYPGSDYYEIELGEFTEKMHSDLPNSTIRGYRQTNTADPTVSQFHYLGPLIIATSNRLRCGSSSPTNSLLVLVVTSSSR